MNISEIKKRKGSNVEQKYPLFILYNKATIPDRKKNLRKYKNVLNSLVQGCKFLQKNKCKFISIPCNTAHHWYKDLKKEIKIPILNMPEIVYFNIKNNCKKNTKIGLLATDATIAVGVYSQYLDKKFNLIIPPKNLQIRSVNKSIKLVKMGKTKEAEKAIKPAVNYLIKKKCKKIILGCTELPIAIFAYKSFKKAKLSKTFLDPNLILAQASMKKYK